MTQSKVGIQPVGHIILVRPDEIVKTTASGIVITTDTHLQREEMAQTEGQVIALGSTAYSDQIIPWCKPGDRVLFAKYAGTYCKGSDGLVYRLINDLDVKAILTKDQDNV